MLVYFALGDAKVWCWGSKPTPVPNANGLASQWNIGLSVLIKRTTVWKLMTEGCRGSTLYKVTMLIGLKTK